MHQSLRASASAAATACATWAAKHGMLAQLTRLRSDHQISDVALQGDGFFAKPARKVAARGLRLEKAALAVSTRGAGFLSISAQRAKLCLLRGPPYPTFSFQKLTEHFLRTDPWWPGEPQGIVRNSGSSVQT